MKLSIRIPDALWELYFEPGEEGVLQLAKAFLKFPDRSGCPHFSFFAKPRKGWLTPHGTAFRGHRRESRHNLPRVRPEEIQGFGIAAGSALCTEFVESLNVANLEAMEEEGWTAHWPDFRALHRWVRRAVRSHDLRFDDETAEVCAWHLLGRGCLPTHLVSQEEEVAKHDPLLFALRWHDGIEEPDVRVLKLLPGNLVAPVSDDLRWYWHSTDIGARDALAQTVPLDAIEAASEEARAWLETFPARGEHRPPSEGAPAWAWFVAGYLGDPLLRLAVAEVQRTTCC